MISLDTVLDIVNYQITEGSEAMWPCLGSSTYCISSWDRTLNKYEICAYFDPVTREVFFVEACDYSQDRAYRYINPAWRDVINNWASEKGHDVTTAWDGVNFIELEVESDWVAKAASIVKREDYDARILIEVELDEDTIASLHALHQETAPELSFDEFTSDLVHQYAQRVIRQNVV
jgi:hypothetical protein